MGNNKNKIIFWGHFLFFPYFFFAVTHTFYLNQSVNIITDWEPVLQLWIQHVHALNTHTQSIWLLSYI